MLPEEVWEDILKFLDVIHLMELKRVSKHWCEMITRVIERECKWYEKCVKVVPEDTWSSILENHSHPEICCEDFHGGKKHSKIWISLYRSWLGWNTLVEKDFSTESIEIFTAEQEEKDISCLAVKSNLVGIGTGSDTRVIFYDISRFPGDPIFEASHEQFVTDLFMGRVEGDVIALSSSCMGVIDLQYWNLRKKTQIHRHVSRKYRRYISTSFQYCHIVEDQMHEDGEPYYFLRVERMGSGVDVRPVVHVSIREHGFIRACCADRDKMTIMVDEYEGRRIKLYTSDSSGELKEMSSNELHVNHDRSIFLFNPSIAVYKDGYGGTAFAFSINGRKWKKYSVECDLGLSFPVSYVLYHVGLLILALKSGDVLIVYVKNPDGLERLDLKTMPTRKIKLDSAPIKAVKLTEDNSHQYLVAVTTKKVHVVKFH